MANTVAKYQKYAEYKDSGEDFLPILPSSWEVSRVKKLMTLQRSIVGNKSSSYQLLSLTLKGVIPRDISNGDGKIPESFDTYQVVKADDLVFCLFDMDETPRTIGIAEQKGMITGAYNVYTVKQDNFPKYIYYYFLYLDYFKGLKPYYTGLRKVVRADTFANIKMPCPSFFEQIQIANFLDHETAKIDSLIANQEKLIELLKEKRQAVISHAVTKGLNSKVPMKDSGNIWAEKIPNHWKLTKLTYVARVGNGATPSRDNEAYWKDGSIGWLNSSKVNDVIITEADQFITPLAKTQTSVQIVQPNDLVMAITGEGQTRGRVAMCQLDATINQHLASIRITDKNLNHEFLFCWLTANYERIRYESTGAGSTKGAITCGDIGLYPVPLPPYAEQLEIVANIKKQSDTFKRLIVKAESAIQLMQERRTALISSAVTGKIDVRNWQHPNEAKTELSL